MSEYAQWNNMNECIERMPMQHITIQIIIGRKKMEYEKKTAFNRILPGRGRVHTIHKQINKDKRCVSISCDAQFTLIAPPRRDIFIESTLPTIGRQQNNNKKYE